MWQSLRNIALEIAELYFPDIPIAIITDKECWEMEFSNIMNATWDFTLWGFHLMREKWVNELRILTSVFEKDFFLCFQIIG